jgi:hypothetical protein
MVEKAVADPVSILDGIIRASERPTRSTGPSVVYYLLVGDMVKIGVTRRLDERLRNYPPSAVLLATEPGDEHMETRRLRQFAALRAAGREWFHAGPELRTHIEALQAAAA